MDIEFSPKLKARSAMLEIVTHCTITAHSTVYSIQASMWNRARNLYSRQGSEMYKKTRRSWFSAFHVELDVNTHRE